MAVSRRCQTHPATRSTRWSHMDEPRGEDEAASDHEHWTRRTAVVTLGTLLGTGCLGTPPAPTGGDESATEADPTNSVTETPTATTELPVETTETPPVDSPKVADVLVGLVRAEDRTAYAAERNLDYRDGRVLVVIELTSNTEPPTVVPLDVVARGGDAVEAYVDPDDIPALAAAENVRVVRPPRLSAPSSQHSS